MMNGLTKWRLTMATVFPVLFSVCSAGPILADEAAAARGRAVVEQWCRLCHLRAGDAPDPDMAPPYEDIVMRPGRDRVYFEQFMREDHFPMTTFRLFAHEKSDVVEYLVALREAALD